MSIESLNPYIILNGTAAQAIGLYEQALGARTVDRMRFGDAPPDMKMKSNPALADRIMHASLSIGKAVVMLSDTLPEQPITQGDHVQIALHFDDPADMVKKFDALSAGGKVTSPITEAFWGAQFGTLVDRFGVPWMFNCQIKKA
jgi:PhnB protein